MSSPQPLWQQCHMEDNFSMDWDKGDGLGMIQARYIYCALYFYHYYDIRSTSDHQT